jgi:hypothetical protein
MKLRITTLAGALVLSVGVSRPAAAEPPPTLQTASCLDTEEVLIIEDDVSMSIDREAESRKRAQQQRARRERRKAERREAELRREVEATERAREEAESRASLAEQALTAQRKALAEAYAAAVAGEEASARPPALAAAPPATSATGAVAPSEQADASTRVDAATTTAPGLAREHQERHRLARIEIAVGGGLLGLAAGGFGMLGAGMYLYNATERERARAEGLGVEDFSPLRSQERRAQGLAIAGGVVGTASAVLGGTLLGLGARDLLRARRGQPPGRRARRPSSPRVRMSLGPGPTTLGASLRFRL